MVNFVKPQLLGTISEFRNRFINPIHNGMHADSTKSDVKTMKGRAFVLNSKVKNFVQVTHTTFHYLFNSLSNLMLCRLHILRFSICSMLYLLPYLLRYDICYI